MPFDIDPIYVIYLFVALAAGLFFEGIYLLFFNARSYRKNVNRRLKLLDNQPDREGVLVQLRRERGLSMTGDYRLPLKIAAPFPNQFCLRCHSDGRKFIAEDSHLDADGAVAKDLVTGVVRCDECHGPSHQVNRRERTSREGR